MNKQNKEECKNRIELLNWLINKADTSFPEIPNNSVSTYKGIGKVFKKTFEKMIEYDLSDVLFVTLNQYWSNFQNTLISLKSVEEGKPNTGLPQLISEIHAQITNLSAPSSPNSINQFQSIASFVSTLSDNENIEEIEASKRQLNKITKDTSELLTLLQIKSGEIGIEKFAEIFGEQAYEHSRFLKKLRREKSFWNFIKIGSAQIWLTIALFTLFIPPFWLIESPSNEVIRDLTLLLIYIGKKIIQTSIWIYFVRFSFRNYSNHTYLSIQNKHRQNVLNSFKLLLESLPIEDTNSRSALINSVSKSIFSNEKNPYQIDVKKNDYDLQGILEILKILKG